MKNIVILCTAILLLVTCKARTQDTGRTDAGTRDSTVTTATTGKQIRKGSRTAKTDAGTRDSTVATAMTVKPVVNVYIENSISMDGYVKGVTEFEEAIHRYLAYIKKEKIADSLNLFYINSIVLKQKDDVEAFIKNLEPAYFKREGEMKGGNRKTSDISNVIKLTLEKTDENDIAILVTDGIFSPGKKDAKAYLLGQETEIMENMSRHLDKYPNTAVIVYQLFSKFNGTYFNYQDANIPHNGQRPYYIYIFGQAKYLAELRRKIPESSFEGGGVKKMFSISAENQQVDYAVIRGSGRFDILRNSKTDIINLKKDSRSGNVTFAITANFQNLLLDEGYLTNPDNYELKDYSLKIKKNENSGRYTLSLQPQDNNPHKGAVTLKLKMATPDWSDVNDDDGATAVAGKTFGIKYQIQGIFNAYTHPGKQAYYTEIKINIK
ncbi:MAG: hypothetical protein LBK97_03165 [Prevotellaceae bacterium]|nr:hypothetical protein [Prevotellaceae bacterium]